MRVVPVVAIEAQPVPAERLPMEPPPTTASAFPPKKRTLFPSVHWPCAEKVVSSLFKPGGADNGVRDIRLPLCYASTMKIAVLTPVYGSPRTAYTRSLADMLIFTAANRPDIQIRYRLAEGHLIQNRNALALAAIEAEAD